MIAPHVPAGHDGPRPDSWRHPTRPRSHALMWLEDHKLAVPRAAGCWEAAASAGGTAACTNGH